MKKSARKNSKPAAPAKSAKSANSSTLKSDPVRTAPQPSTPEPAAAAQQPAASSSQPAVSSSKARAVRFSFQTPNAQSVFVAGTFNNWQPEATPLFKQDQSLWATELELDPGRYEYRFVVDGNWTDDPNASAFEANPHGGSNCIVEVK
jgi:1,4-alpha-glucan branching enzyme